MKTEGLGDFVTFFQLLVQVEKADFVFIRVSSLSSHSLCLQSKEGFFSQRDTWLINNQLTGNEGKEETFFNKRLLGIAQATWLTSPLCVLIPLDINLG